MDYDSNVERVKKEKIEELLKNKKNGDKIRFEIEKVVVDLEDYSNLKLVDFIRKIKSNVYEFDKKSNNIDTLALKTFK